MIVIVHALNKIYVDQDIATIHRVAAMCTSTADVIYYQYTQYQPAALLLESLGYQHNGRNTQTCNKLYELISYLVRIDLLRRD